MSRLVPALPPHAQEAIHAFLRDRAIGDGRKGGIVGLSGGIDSAVVARLARDALGRDRVLGVLMPDASFPEALHHETELFARSLGIAARAVPIEPILDDFRAVLPELDDRVTRGNTKARIRMAILYAIAREQHCLVLGTGNKSELLLGYYTKYGDGGVDLLPIGDLYKTQIRDLARDLELPAPIRARAPTADLWPGQTDEGELGLPYEVLDEILYGIEQLLPEPEIAEITRQPIGRVREISRRVIENGHKRQVPPVAMIGSRTIGVEGRE